MSVCRESLALYGEDQSINMESAPDLPTIWSRHSPHVSARLRDSVDSVIAQVS